MGRMLPMLLCFFCSGELTSLSESHYDPLENLCFRDIAFNDRGKPSVLRVLLKTSRTDSFCLGVDNSVGKTDDDFCPITAMVHYLPMCGGRDGPLFIYSNEKFLTRENLVTHIRDALSSSGINASNYSGHSFRSGAATTALQGGVGDTAIQMLGQWRSDAYKRYIKTPGDQLAAFSVHLAKQ